MSYLKHFLRSVFSNKSLLNKYEYFLALIFARASKYANIVRLSPSFPTKFYHQSDNLYPTSSALEQIFFDKVVVVLKCIPISVHTILTITVIIIIIIAMIIIITIISIRLFLRVLGQLLVRVHSVKFGKNSPLKSGTGGLSTFPGDF